MTEATCLQKTGVLTEQGLLQSARVINPQAQYQYVYSLGVLHIVLTVLVGRICTNIETFTFGDHFLYSHDLYV